MAWSAQSHNYAGLSFGNVASFSNVKSASNPRQAALQGLAKMRELAARGFAQAVLPPQSRPNFRMLRKIWAFRAPTPTCWPAPGAKRR
jgi:succinylarginine dihydrolase